VANSETVKRSAMRHLRVPEARITVIPRGIAWENLAVISPEQAQAARAELGWTDAAPFLLCVGRLVPQKGLRYLVDAMAVVTKKLPGARLGIAGEGRLRASLEEQIRTLGLGGIVRLLGERRDVPRLLAAADVFVFPSLSEGSPNALLEAMAYGRPCIASAIDAVEEIAGTDGAILVPPRSPQALAEAILAAAGDPQRRRTLAAAAHLRARAFDMHDSVDRLEEIYRSMAPGHDVGAPMVGANIR
jgi:glycosyltransferase involved in cell wall biosynthesis